jgi:small subunit ribosomal protein S20
MAKKQTQEQKRAHQNKKKKLRNLSVKSGLKTVFKSTLETFKSKKGDAALALRQAVKLFDQAVAKGVIHKNQASRKKSQLYLFFNKQAAAPASAKTK